MKGLWVLLVLTGTAWISVKAQDPRSNQIGSPCSADTSQAWLDVVFVIDTSSAMDPRDLLELSGEIATFMRTFNFSQTGDHTTRAAIITYASEVKFRYNLTTGSDFGAFEDAIFNLPDYSMADDDAGNVQGALQAAHTLIQAERTKRVPVIILVAAAYQEAGFTGAYQTAKVIKDDGISIMTISFAASDGVLTDQLKNISTEGYSYLSNLDGISLILPYALTQINCFCPDGTLQFRIYDPISRNYTSYADCLYGFDGDTYPDIAERTCRKNNAYLASITSQPKLDFVTDYVIPHEFKNRKNITIGCHANGTQWNWYGYGSEYPLGVFPVLAQSPAPGEIYTFIYNYYGFNWKMMPLGDTPLAYLCQSQACDASYVCL